MALTRQVKSVLNRKRKRDEWFLDDYTLNLYSGCSFNCLYCYIRGSKYGKNLADRLCIKENAIELLDKQLALESRKGRRGIIAISSVTDPYLPIDKKYQLTRQALEIILKYKYPVHILTKSDLIERDFDLLHRIDREAIHHHNLKRMRRGVVISFSFSTLDDPIAKIFEPGAPPPSVRLHALEKSVSAGLFAGVSMMPLLPFISDGTERLQHMFTTFQSAKVKYILPATLTLFGNKPEDSKQMMLRAVENHYPHLLEKYKNYFSTGSQMPAFYRTAFQKEMQKYSEQYGIPNHILTAATQEQ